MMKKSRGFTLFELLISIAILGIIASIALPNLNEYLVKIRVDNEISQLHRLLLLGRNGAISSEHSVTICHLDSSNKCTNAWDKEVTVFLDIDSDGIYEDTNDEYIIQVKSSISAGDTLLFPRSQLTYQPTGQLSGISNGTFEYCPKDNIPLSRGLILFRTGRAYQTSDIDNDGKDERRNGAEIDCT